MVIYIRPLTGKTQQQRATNWSDVWNGRQS